MIDWLISILVTNKWEEKKCSGDTPPPLYSHSTVSFEDKLYLFGGQNEKNEFFNNMYILNIGMNLIDLVDWLIDWFQIILFGVRLVVRRWHLPKEVSVLLLY